MGGNGRKNEGHYTLGMVRCSQREIANMCSIVNEREENLWLPGKRSSSG